MQRVSRRYTQDPFYQVWGPFTNEDLESELAQGDVLVAAQGMKAWVPASEQSRPSRE